VSSSDTFPVSSGFNLHLIVRSLFLVIAEVSNQMLELYEQNHSKQAQLPDGNEAEGSSASVRNQQSSVKSEGNPKESSAHGYHHGSKQINSKNSSLTGVSDVKHTDSDKQISEHNMLRNSNGDHGSDKDRSYPSGGRLDADTDSLPDHQCSKSSYESDLQEDKSHQSHDSSNEIRDGVPNGNEGPSVSSSMMDAMNKIDKDKVKAALEKRRKLK
jgi:cyclin T